MTDYIISGIYGERDYGTGTPMGTPGLSLVAVVGRGDKKIPSPVLGSASLIYSSKTTGYTVDTIPAAATYYKITAYKGNKETAQPKYLTLPVQTLTAGDTSVYSVLLTWSPVSGVDGYKIYRSADYSTWGDTCLIGTVEGQATSFEDNKITATAGTPPLVTTGLLVEYNTPVTYYDMTEMREKHGNTSALGIAATIASRVGLSRLVAVSVDYTSVDSQTAGSSEYKAALKSAYEAALKPLETVEVDRVAVLSDDAGVITSLIAHLSKTNGAKLQFNRMGVCASCPSGNGVDTNDVKNIISFSKELKNNRLVTFAPNTAQISIVDDNGDSQVMTLTGEYLAFAEACKKSVIGDASNSMTDSEIEVFDKLGKAYGDTEQENLILVGVNPVNMELSGYKQVCVDDLTTSRNTKEESSWAIMESDIYIGKRLVEWGKPYKVKHITNSYLKSFNNKMAEKIKTLEGTIITKLVSISTKQDTDNPEKVICMFYYIPMWSSKIILFKWGFSAVTGS